MHLNFWLKKSQVIVKKSQSLTYLFLSPRIKEYYFSDIYFFNSIFQIASVVNYKQGFAWCRYMENYYLLKQSKNYSAKLHIILKDNHVLHLKSTLENRSGKGSRELSLAYCQPWFSISSLLSFSRNDTWVLRFLFTKWSWSTSLCVAPKTKII